MIYIQQRAHLLLKNNKKKLYDYATDESYNALVIDATKGRPIFKKKFECILKIN